MDSEFNASCLSSQALSDLLYAEDVEDTEIVEDADVAHPKQSRHETPNMEPESPPLRFLDLPRELRDLVYDFALVDEKPQLDIFRVNRQLYEEASLIFFSRNEFEFRDLPVALQALSSNHDAVKNIRRIRLYIYEQPQDHDDGLYYNKDGAFGKLCDLFATKSQLLKLFLYIDDSGINSTTPQNAVLTKTQSYAIPPWVYHLTRLDRLRSLHFIWHCSLVSYFGTMLSAAKLMRTTMLHNGATMSNTQGIRLFRHHQMIQNDNDVCGIRIPVRSLQLEMKFDDNGHSNFHHYRRIRMQPYCWCMDCGRFETEGFCECGGPFRDEGCESCEIECWKLCECGSSRYYCGLFDKENTVHQLFSNEGEATPTADNVWNSKKWGGKPFQEYLPAGATEKDFFNAKAWTNAECHQVELPQTWDGDYTGSDFGDNDSMFTVHGWSDEEETEVGNN